MQQVAGRRGDEFVLTTGNYTEFSIEKIVPTRTCGSFSCGRVLVSRFWSDVMTAKLIAVAALGLLLGGCVTQSTLEPSSDANLKPRDKQLLANAPYQQAQIPEPYRVTSSITIARKRGYDRDRYRRTLSLLRAAARPSDPLRCDRRRRSADLLRRCRVGNMQEWPNWTPTADIKKRLGNIPNFVSGGPHNPLGPARSIFTRATGTRCSAFMAPTSRNTSDTQFRRAVSAHQ